MPATTPATSLTELLRAWRNGEPAAFDEVVYQELRRLAAFHLRRERPGHTLEPTALIHEAYLRLAGSENLEFRDRAHFFAIASKNMRQILVDHARRRCAGKRGDGAPPVSFGEQHLPVGRPAELVALDDALAALAAQDERKARVLELCYFGGLTQEEIALALDLHVNTVARDLRFAEAWLRKELAAPRSVLSA